MNMMASVAGIGLIFGFFMMLLPIALLIVLQVWLCKKGKWLGVILPALALAMSLLMVLSMTAFQGFGGSTLILEDGNGQIIQEHHQQIHREMTPGAVGAIATVFLVSNIPTLVFGGIWLHFKNRKDFQDDLKKMKIEDLE